MCPRCGREDESAIHAIRNCSKARDVLATGGIDRRVIDSKWDRCIDWLEEVMRLLDKRAFESLIIVLCNIWNSRNNFIFRGKEEEAGLIWERAKMLGDDFRLHNFTSVPLIPKPIRPIRWTKPPDGVTKVNVDAAWVNDKVGIGVVARDCEGFVLGGKLSYRENVANIGWAEMEAIRDGILWACDKSITKTILESDSASMINRIKSKHEDFTIIGYYIKEIREMVVFGLDCDFNWSGRKSNKTADRLSEFALHNQCNFFFFGMDYPKKNYSIVIDDSF